MGSRIARRLQTEAPCAAGRLWVPRHIIIGMSTFTAAP